MKYLDLLRLAAPEAIVVLIALAVLTISLTNDRSRNLPAVIAGFGILLAIWTTLRLPPHANLFGGMFVISPLNSLFKVISLTLALVTVPLAASEKSLRNPGEYLAMLLLGTVGLLLLIGSEEFLMIFIGLELLGLSLYVMAAFDKTDLGSAEAGLKYFLFGSTASAFTLFGISLVYGMSGTTALSSISASITRVPVQPLFAVGIIMTLVGFAFKIAAAPFHLWAPDAYQGAPVSSAAFIASGSKVAAFVALGKIALTGFAPMQGNAGWHAMLPGWSPILAALAALSILLGNFVALIQTNVRRLLAYSAVAHAGYTLLGLVSGSREGFSATLFYTTIYAITLIGAFAVVGLVKRETGGDDFQNFAGLAKRSPLVAASMAVFMLSLAGLPPLAGFFGKFYLFSAAFRAGGSHGLLWLVILALFGSFVSLYYYLSVLKVIFVDSPASSSTSQQRQSGSDLDTSTDRDYVASTTMAILAAAVLVFGALPEILVGVIVRSVP